MSCVLRGMSCVPYNRKHVFLVFCSLFLTSTWRLGAAGRGLGLGAWCSGAYAVVRVGARGLAVLFMKIMWIVDFT